LRQAVHPPDGFDAPPQFFGHFRPTTADHGSWQVAPLGLLLLPSRQQRLPDRRDLLRLRVAD
jgi:hypothetical protein